MNSNWKLLPATLLVAVLALAGCGGGGGDDDTMAPDMADEQAAMELAARQEEQRDAIEDAIDASVMAIAAINEADDDTIDQALMDASDAWNGIVAAVDAATDLDPDDVAVERGKVAAVALAQVLKSEMDARQAVLDDAQTEKAKALSKAIAAGNALTNAVVTTASLDVDTTDTGLAAISLEKSEVALALGNWMGAHHSGTNGAGAAMTSGMLRAYSNAESPDMVPFIGPAGEAVHGLTATVATDDGNAYVVPVGANANIAGPSFPKTGTRTYSVGSREFTGTFMKASGTYSCTVAPCMAGPNAQHAIVLTGTWSFTPNSDAMLLVPDSAYLQFGWWLREDKDGPTHAGTIYGGIGVTAATESAINLVNRTGTDVTATYNGSAAGKFSVSDPLRSDEDNAGHFTADAELTATFSAASTLEGTIDAFRLNDGNDDPGWAVELQKAGLLTTPANTFGTGAAPNGDQTVWSINGNKGAASGSWEAQMFEDKGDNNTTPDSVIGSFVSNFGAHVGDRNTHSMVGAFGAELDNN